MFTSISVSTFIIHYVDTFVKLYLKNFRGAAICRPLGIGLIYVQRCALIQGALSQGCQYK